MSKLIESEAVMERASQFSGQEISDTTDRESSKVFFPNLDGLRFIAFFLVYLQHGFGMLAGQVSNNSLVSAFAHRILACGWAGVSFFFVLSGFLITYLILTEIKVRGKVDVLAFYVRRVLRIWPLYYMVIAFGFLVYPLAKTVFGFSSYIEAGNPIYYIFFLGNFDVINLGFNRGAMSTNITWSVAIEEQFYITWPLLFYLMKPRLYPLLFLVIIAISCLFRYLHLSDSMALYFHTLSVISDMAVGGLSAYLALNSRGFRDWFVRCPRWLLLVIYSVGIILMLFRRDVFVGSIPGALERVVISLFFAFVVLDQNYSTKSFFKMHKAQLLSTLGKYTYGLYLLHPIALLVLDAFLKLVGWRRESLAVGIPFGIAGLALSIAISIASYHLVEVKFLRLKRRFTYVESAPRTS